MSTRGGSRRGAGIYGASYAWGFLLPENKESLFWCILYIVLISYFLYIIYMRPFSSNLREITNDKRLRHLNCFAPQNNSK